MKVLITGSAGFVGYQLCLAFAKHGMEVLAGYRRKFPAGLAGYGNIRPIKIDVSIPLDIEESVDIIIHTAASTRITENVTKEAYIQDNLWGCVNVAKFAEKKNVQYVFFFSTISVYGQVLDSPLKETSCINNPELYGLSKLMGEKIFDDYQGVFNTISLRLPGVVGENYFLPWLGRIMKQLMRNENVTVYNPDGLFNNVIDTYEIFRFLKMILESGFRGNEVVNLAASNPIQISEMIEMMKSELASNSLVNTVVNKQTPFLIDISKVNSVFGFEPASTLETVKRYCRQNIETKADK